MYKSDVSQTYIKMTSKRNRYVGGGRGGGWAYKKTSKNDMKLTKSRL